MGDLEDLSFDEIVSGIDNDGGVDASKTQVANTEPTQLDIIEEQSSEQDDKQSSNIDTSAQSTLAQQQEVPPQQEAQRPTGFSDTNYDENGNVVLFDGTIIPAGLPRRIFDQHVKPAVNKLIEVANKATQDNIGAVEQIRSLSGVLLRVRDEIVPQYEKQIADLNGRVQAYEQAVSSVREYGLSSEEAIEAHKLSAIYKSNPVKCIQLLIANAAEQGYDVSTLGIGFDQVAVQKMLDTRLSPIIERERNQQLAEQRQQEGVRRANQFFGQFPDARVHEAEIAHMIQADRNLSPESAYYKLQLAYQREGLNWSKPLNEAYAEKHTPVQREEKPKPVQLPSGRGSANVAVPLNKPITVSSSMTDIVRQAMEENGLKIR